MGAGAEFDAVSSGAGWASAGQFFNNIRSKMGHMSHL